MTSTVLGESLFVFDMQTWIIIAHQFSQLGFTDHDGI